MTKLPSKEELVQASSKQIGDLIVPNLKLLSVESIPDFILRIRVITSLDLAIGSGECYFCRNSRKGCCIHPKRKSF